MKIFTLADCTYKYFSMYTYKEITEIHFELSSNCQASCPMCARNFHGGGTNPLLKVNDITIDVFKKIIPSDLIKQLKNIVLCGNFGDPLLNNDLIPIVEYLIDSNPLIRISLHTNGSLRNEQWWESLARTLTTHCTVNFGIDGLADTHSLYRIGTDWNKIIKNACAFINAGGNATWVFITFKHNEHQVDGCRQLSKQLGFKGFQEKQTGRFIGFPYFEVLDKNGQVTHRLQQPNEQRLIFVNRRTIENYKEIFKTATVDCEVKKTSSVYIDALGYIWPCCFVGAVPYLHSVPNQLVFEYQNDNKETFYKLIEKFGGMEKFNLQLRTIEDIVDSLEWQSIWDQTFKDNSLRVCTRTCGKFPTPTISQSKDQFIDLKEFYD